MSLTLVLSSHSMSATATAKVEEDPNGSNWMAELSFDVDVWEIDVTTAAASDAKKEFYYELYNGTVWTPSPKSLENTTTFGTTTGIKDFNHLTWSKAHGTAYIFSTKSAAEDYLFDLKMKVYQDVLEFNNTPPMGSWINQYYEDCHVYFENGKLVTEIFVGGVVVRKREAIRSGNNWTLSYEEDYS